MWCIGNYKNLCHINVEENEIDLHLYRYFSETISPIRHIPITLIYLKMKIFSNIV